MMHERLRKIKDEDVQRVQDRKKVNRVSFYGILLCVFLSFVVSAVTAEQKKQAPAPESERPWTEVSQLQPEPSVAAPGAATPAPAAELPWELMVVNKNQRLPQEFSLVLRDIEGERVDERIYEPITALLAAAAADGVSLQVCSGYRSVRTQDELFSRKVQEWVEKGLGEEASVAEAGKYLQPPGASEHHTGLAMDFLTEGYQVLDSGFADTQAYKWLTEHAAEYGFIERYPKDKEGETGVLWEPWHYRYVGASYAGAIEADGVSLEVFAAGVAAGDQN